MPSYLVQGPVFLPAVGGWAGVTSGLTHHWPMDDANVCNDIVGSLHGTANGAGVTSAAGPGGVVGAARQFDGVNVITLPSDPFPDIVGADTTLCAWVYAPDTTLAPDGSPFFMNITGGSDSIGISYVEGVSPVVVSLDPASGAGNSINNRTLTSPLASGTWTHICWTKPGSGDYLTTKVYANGVDVSSTGSLQTAQSTNNVFGGRGTASRRLPNGSRIGRIVTYSRVLSGAEITQNYGAL